MKLFEKITTTNLSSVNACFCKMRDFNWVYNPKVYLYCSKLINICTKCRFSFKLCYFAAIYSDVR